MRNGKIPFIGASDCNNGVTGFISNINASMDSNVLGVNYNGSVGESFYHPYTAIFSDDVKRLRFTNGDNNKQTLLFLKIALTMQKSKYAYGYKFNAHRMRRQMIMLPSCKNGEPDYQFMDKYIEQLEIKQIVKYLECRTNKKE